jgi:hypothetical protein
MIRASLLLFVSGIAGLVANLLGWRFYALPPEWVAIAIVFASTWRTRD